MIFKIKVGVLGFFQFALANRSERLLRCLSIAFLSCIEIFGVVNIDSEDPNFICAFVLACIDFICHFYARLKCFVSSLGKWIYWL